MQKIYEGKTKDVYRLDDGNYQFLFKDDVTGTDGLFDPGSNTVGLKIEGAGLAGLAMSVYFFKLLTEIGFPTHFISAEENRMTIKPAAMFGGGLEVICRYKALGSFIRRYGDIIREGASLNALVEMTLKNDECGDPLINEDAVEALGILEPGEYSELKSLTQSISAAIKAELAAKGLELCDIKLEFGKDKDGTIMLIDEISGGNMRVMENGITLQPLELSKKILNN